ncbi:MAG: Inner membrane protein YjcH [Candidatus Accumulibacter adjunctus]|uniref:Inner membrane protein YjcH n=1 Tax=Candidatus Accumulibacter adjunctus TaxID=1454001 RepID=A0A011PTU4_9PROT|nr:MAG: Inner membrane protein YjcH [Candidatus Accumulibacter adjunctus]
MSSVIYERMRVNPKFHELVQKRGRFAWTLATIVLVLFYGFFMLVAFNPGLLGQKVAEGSMWPIGYTIELILFVFFWLTTVVYVRRANGEFDDLTQELIKEAQKEGK